MRISLVQHKKVQEVLNVDLICTTEVQGVLNDGLTCTAQRGTGGNTVSVKCNINPSAKWITAKKEGYPQ